MLFFDNGFARPSTTRPQQTMELTKINLLFLKKVKTPALQAGSILLAVDL
jgi:hypothetical protein